MAAGGGVGGVDMEGVDMERVVRPEMVQQIPSEPA